MKMLASKVWLAVVLSVTAAAQNPLNTHATTIEKKVPFEIVSSSKYQVFIKNWDENLQPVFCARITSLLGWDKIFQPAMTMWNTPLLAPPSAFFNQRQFLLFSRVVPASDEVIRGKVFKVNAVSARGGALSVAYQYRLLSKNASSWIKEYVLISIKKNNFDTGPVSFLENGAVACEVS